MNDSPNPHDTGWVSRITTSGHCRTDSPYIPRLKPARETLPPSALASGESAKEMPGKDSKRLSQGAGGRAPCAATPSDAAPFLDKIQINRNRTDQAERCPPQGRNRNCGRFTVTAAVSDGQRRFIRVDCKCWDCSYCGPRKARKYKRTIRDLAEANKLNRFLTLTLDPKLMNGVNPVAYINDAFAKWRTYLKREFGASITYIRVLEFQQNGNPHFHILVDRFIPHAWIQETWQSVGGGKFVNIKCVDLHRVSRYLSKYLTKELLMSAPKRSRRITVSRGLRLVNKKTPAENWRLMRTSIWVLYDLSYPDPLSIELDKEGVLKSFSVFQPHESSLPPTLEALQ